MTTPSASIIVLTFNRNNELRDLLVDLEPAAKSVSEIIVVDNASDRAACEVTNCFPQVRTIRSDVNKGTAGRNLGSQCAVGDILIFLDDDVSGLTTESVQTIKEHFLDPSVAAVNFHVLAADSDETVNWVHHRDPKEWSNRPFDTYEITEGAVAIRRSVFIGLGGYPESFFLSHEGPDLAYRIMNIGYRVIYSPHVTVRHSFASQGRASWRNYYLDTRNTFWLVARNLPCTYGAAVLCRQIGAMLIYSLRDGYLWWWCKAIVDGIAGLPRELQNRNPISGTTMARIRLIDSRRPPLLSTVRRRIWDRKMRL